MRLIYTFYALSVFAFFPQTWSKDTSSQPKGPPFVANTVSIRFGNDIYKSCTVVRGILVTDAPARHAPTICPLLNSDLYVALGSSVELPCVDGRTNGSEWRLNGSFLVSSPAVHLYNTSLDDRGFYTCHDSNGEIIETVRLQLGYTPSVPDVHCWSPSYPLKALCSWTLPQDPILPTYYISTYRHLEDVYSCQRQNEQDRQCVLEDLELYSNTPYLVNITAVNALGSASRILPVIFEDIVKPDPPVNVKVTALPGKKLHIQWAPPPTWPDLVNFPLKYKVQFQWGHTNAATLIGPVESESMVRSGVMPGRTYHIRVSGMDLLGHGQSSEWSDTVNITMPKS